MHLRRSECRNASLTAKSPGKPGSLRAERISIQTAVNHGGHGTFCLRGMFPRTLLDQNQCAGLYEASGPQRVVVHS